MNYLTKKRCGAYFLIALILVVSAFALPGILFENPTPVNGTYNSTHVINVSASGTNLSNLSIYVNSVEVKNCGNNTLCDYTLSSDGTYVFFGRVNDTDSLVNVTAVRNVTIDLTAPSISYVSPTPDNGSYNLTQTINVSSSDVNLDSIVIYVSGSVAQVCSVSPCSYALIEGDSNFYAFANDTAGNSNVTAVRNVTIDLTDPTITIGSPVSTTYGTTNVSLKVVADETISSWWYSINGTNVAFTPNTTLVVSDGAYTINVSANDSVGNVGLSSVSFTVNSSDSDGDGVPDINDTVEGDGSNVDTVGVSNINVTIGGNATGDTITGTHEVLFSDGVTPLINFTHDFSSSSLDFSKIIIKKSSNYLLVNLSGQLQAGIKKTLYLTDSNFNSLCVKDAEISEISEISSICNGTDEIDFDSCLGNSTGVTISGVTCYDEGSIIKIENLNHSAIKATITPTTTTTSSSSRRTSSLDTNPVPPTAFTSVPTIDANTPEIIYLPNQEETGISEFVINVKEPLTNVKIIINSLSKKPYILPDAGIVYKYLKIDERNINEEDLNEPMKIKFRVSRQWLNENSLGQEQVQLKKYNNKNDEWDSLYTAFTDSDDEFAYYESETYSLSYYAIADGQADVILSVEMKEKPLEEIPAKTGINLTSKIIGLSVVVVAALTFITLYFVKEAHIKKKKHSKFKKNMIALLKKIHK